MNDYGITPPQDAPVYTDLRLTPLGRKVFWTAFLLLAFTLGWYAYDILDFARDIWQQVTYALFEWTGIVLPGYPLDL